MLRSVTTRCKWRLLLMSLSLQGMVIWVVEVSREGYKLKYIFGQKSISSREIVVHSLWIDIDFSDKNLFNFVYPPRKLNNPYYHNARLAIFCNHPRLDKLAQQCTTEEGFKIGAINQSTIFLLLGLVATIYGHFWILLITVILLVVSIRILIES